MSHEELDPVSVIERVIERRLTQREAARLLGSTSRHVRRLRRAYERDGPEGLTSKHRGRPSNRASDSESVQLRPAIAILTLRPRVLCDLEFEALATCAAALEADRHEQPTDSDS